MVHVSIPRFIAYEELKKNLVSFRGYTEAKCRSKENAIRKCIDINIYNAYDIFIILLKKYKHHWYLSRDEYNFNIIHISCNTSTQYTKTKTYKKE